MNRFDVAQATYWWLADNHDGQWSDTYRALCQLGEIYRPGPSERGPSPDSEAEEIYNTLTEEAALANVATLLGEDDEDE